MPLLPGHAVVCSLEDWGSIAREEVCGRSWQYMKPLMETNPDGSPVATALREVFFLE
jgi:L-rhamnose mutarotase